METIQRKTSSTIRVLMFPWLAHGHISPFLELSKKLAKRNFYIYFCSTPINLNSIKPKLLSSKYSFSIQLVELNLPLSFPELPSHYHTTNGLPPHLMSTLKKAFELAIPTFFNILKSLNPDLIIYDFLQPWAPSLASSLNIPAVNFLSTSMAMTCFAHFYRNPDEKFPFQEIYPLGFIGNRVLQTLDSSSTGVRDGDRSSKCFEKSCHLILAKTFRELEGKYIDYLSTKLKKKIIPVGPLVQDPITHEDEKMEVNFIINWLQRKERSSTVFVSFGSEYFLCKEEIEEIANGLELSNVNFIWVVRFPMEDNKKRRKLEEVLPEKYLERVQEKGIVVEDWAPQAKILANCSIGGFVSHCGWSSIMESMKFGVPIIALPMNLDQPVNARLVEEVGVGIEVKRNENGGLEREEIAKTIRKVVVEKDGDDVRGKAREMSDIMRKREDEEIDKMVDELVKLCDTRVK